jgi:benzodiazapine receptor
MRHALRAADRRSLIALGGFLVICTLVAGLASAVTNPKIPTWYAGLTKPAFTPPDWLFGPVWTLLYAMMAIAAWRVWRTQGEPDLRRRALAVFGAQLALNGIWPFAFFGAESPLAGLLVILALEALILWAILLFSRLDRIAALLMAAYAAWVAYAAALNVAILALN